MRWLESATAVLQYGLYLGHYSSMVSSRPAPGLHPLFSLSPPLCPHLCVFSTSGQAAYEAAHVLHTPLADVLHRVCCGGVLPIHEKTSHRAWKSSSGWKWCVNINTGYKVEMLRLRTSWLCHVLQNLKTAGYFLEKRQLICEFEKKTFNLTNKWSNNK